MRTRVTLLILAANLALAAPVAAVDLFEMARLSEPDPVVADELGYAVALRDAEALLSARADGAGANRPGWVRTWTSAGPLWSRFAHFSADDGAALQRFGESLAASGDLAVVGAPRDDDFGEISGSAYVFLRDAAGWSQQAKLHATPPAAFDEFGIAVAIDGDTIVVGCRGDDDGGSQSGSAFIYLRNGTAWPQQAKIIAGDDAAKDLFGSAVALAGDYAVIGAPGDDSKAGAAYVFVRNGSTWSQQARLTAADRAADDVFGTSVSLRGEYAAVGAPGDNAGAGAVYIFKRTAAIWSQVARIAPSGAAAGDAFGFAVARNADQLLVGAPGHDGGRGAASLYERSGSAWIKLARYRASDAAAGSALGASVALGNDYALAGAPGAIGGAGAAYVFNTIALDCNGNGIPDACDTSCLPTNPVTGVSCLAIPTCGTHPDCNVNTIPDACEPDCDTNGTPDDCDIAGGAPDCNTNGLPDSCEPDCNASGIADDCDIANGLSADCNLDGVPDECQLFADEVLLAADFAGGILPAGWSATGLWHVTDQCPSGIPCNPAPWAYFGLAACNFDTGSVASGVLSAPPVALPPSLTSARLTYCSNYDGDRGPAPDGFDAAWVTVNGQIVDDVGATVTGGFWETRTVDLTAFAGQTVVIAWHFDSNDAALNNRLGWQVDGIELLVDSDCNASGLLDACDIATGASADCNSNGVPDECDLAGGGSADCNANATPDECEGGSDCNANGLPDFCETIIRFVDADAPGAASGLDWDNAFTDLQDALAFAGTQCLPVEIWVAAGAYAPAPPGGPRSATFALPPNAALYGGFAGTESDRSARNADPLTNETVLSGDLDGGGPAGNCYHVVTATIVGAGAVLDGFTIRGGRADAAFPHDGGSALLLSQSSPTIANCLFTACNAVAGAVLITGAAPTFSNCTFQGNSSRFGGGLYLEGATTARFMSCRVLGNASLTSGAGGGAFVTAGSKPTWINCQFSGNSATGSGGALFVQSTSQPVLTNCTINRNTSLTTGGGVFATLSSTVRATNCIFWENQDAGGLDQSAQLDSSNATLLVRFCNVQGLAGFPDGRGNIATDPLLADADGLDGAFGTPDDDVQLAPGSPCIDAGSNGVVTVAADLGGLVRRIDDADAVDTGPGAPPIVDIGAFEFQSDCNANGQADSRDIALAVSRDCNANARPDECEISAAGGAPGGPYYCTGECAADCNSNGVPDECDVVGGTSADCAGEGVPDECEPDCNSNGVVDSCDLLAGIDSDCNTNGVPDACELANGDCDGNGVIDACELASPYITATPGPLSPVEGGTVLDFSVPYAPSAISNVVLTFLAVGDLSASAESIEVFLDGVSVGHVFTGSASDCPVFPNQDQLVLSAAAFNALHTGGDLLVELLPTLYVDALPGCDSYVQPALQYQAFSDCDANGIPDACDPDCNANGVADPCDIAAGSAADCNANGVPDDCELAAGTSADTNANLVPDDCELDCDANSVPDECDVDCANSVLATGGSCAALYPAACGLSADCDANGVPDACDADCDDDGVPDTCAVQSGTAPDCNTNGVPDVCDLASQVSADCDTDDVPDECETDGDADGVIDDCDGCPVHGFKSSPGVCGCAVADTDADADGVADCIDDCPDTQPAEAVDASGCPLYGACCLELYQCLDGIDRDLCELPAPLGLTGTYQGNGTTCATDRDHDGVPNCDDACPDDPAKVDLGACGCGIADTDADGDNVADCHDLCPATAAGAGVDVDGCQLYGACCTQGGACFHNTFVTRAWCESQGWTYQGNGSTCALNCAPRQAGDHDADGDVDLEDFAEFTGCAGSALPADGFLPPSALCRLAFDFDLDGDVDLADYGALQHALAE